MKHETGGKESIEHQAAAVLTQAPPISGTWYIILDTVLKARLYWIWIRQNNDDTTARDIEVRITIDGEVFVGAVALANNTPNYAYMEGLPNGVDFGAALFMVCRYDAAEGKSCMVEMRTTSVVGTNLALHGRVVYGLLRP